MRPAESLRQHDALVAALARIDVGLDRGRRGRKHDRNPFDVRAHHRHVARMVTHGIVLLVGLVVLFIDHDQAEIGVREKQRGARPDDDRGFARRNRGPVALPRSRGEFRMPLDRPHTETLRKAVQKLSRERDLRHQDQRLPAPFDDFGNRLEIDFRLAGAGDAIEQRDMKTAAQGKRAQGIDRTALLKGKLGLRVAGIGRGLRGRERQRFRGQRAFIDEAIDHAGRDAGLVRGFGLAVQQAVGQHREQPTPRRRQALRRLPDEPHAHAKALRAEMLAHAQAHAKAHAAGRKRVIGDPVDKRAQFGFQRRHAELFSNVLQTIVQVRIGIGILPPDHRDHLPWTKRNADDIAGLQLHAARHAVGIGLVQREGNQHIDNPRRCGRCVGFAGGLVHRRNSLLRVRLLKSMVRTPEGRVSDQTSSRRALAKGQRKRCDIIRRINAPIAVWPEHHPPLSRSNSTAPIRPLGSRWRAGNPICAPNAGCRPKPWTPMGATSGNALSFSVSIGACG